MKKIIPFTSDIKFNTKIYEITSISLEHNLSIEENNIISGEFIVSGDYKMNDSSINTEPFIHGLPFDITLDTKYDMDRMKIDIDDFKFEIINEEILRVNIDVLIEGIELVELDEEEIKPDFIIDSRSNKNIEDDLIELGFNEQTESDNILGDEIINIISEDERVENMNDYKIEDLFKQDKEIIKAVSNIEEKEEKTETNSAINSMESIFNSFNEQAEKYVTYYVHIVRENDNIDSICLKYGVSIDEIKEYNNIEQITLGSKIIVPYVSNETI